MRQLTKKIAKISLVGAGPGDKDLITVKGLRAIQSADVLLYDALIAKELLEEAPASAKKIFVGKRAGMSCIKQELINQKIVENALVYGHLVRLKGGDPFIFGRGHEELVHARTFGIEIDVIPGISSATSLPLLQHVPITRRGISESFWVLTGSTQNHKLSLDIKMASQTSATLVILMGIRKIPLIQHIFLDEGKENMPVMIIENGAKENERVLLTNVLDMSRDATLAEIGTPGIIVIGEVVAQHPDYQKTDDSNIRIIEEIDRLANDDTADLITILKE